MGSEAAGWIPLLMRCMLPSSAAVIDRMFLCEPRCWTCLGMQ